MSFNACKFYLFSDNNNRLCNRNSTRTILRRRCIFAAAQRRRRSTLHCKRSHLQKRARVQIRLLSHAKSKTEFRPKLKRPSFRTKFLLRVIVNKRKLTICPTRCRLVVAVNDAKVRQQNEREERRTCHEARARATTPACEV